MKLSQVRCGTIAGVRQHYTKLCPRILEYYTDRTHRWNLWTWYADTRNTPTFATRSGVGKLMLMDAKMIASVDALEKWCSARDRVEECDGFLKAFAVLRTRIEGKFSRLECALEEKAAVIC
ncbi:hypothetical protein RP20_CCG019183 [Aedes albopictus]|nr:hypothetical protein RP20_CCG019183 [Aedes albopictus]